MTALSKPGVRLALATASMAATTCVAHREKVGPLEEQAFRRVNELPDSLYRPVWLLMQLGTLGTAPAAATVARILGHRRLASRLLIDGTATWVLSKVVKRAVGRPRPAALLPSTRRRGTDPTGLGYLSGHVGVAMALGMTVFPRANSLERVLILGASAGVGLARMYVGAHLPLDIVGGAALGVGVEAAMCLWRS